MLKIAGLVSLATASFAALVVLSSACTAGVVAPDEAGTSQNGNGNGNGNGAGAGSGSGSGSGSGMSNSCTPETGTYSVHYTKQSGDSSCQTPPDSTITITNKDGGTSSGNASCTSTTDTSTCTTTSHCTTTSKGTTTTFDSTITYSGSSASGTIHEVITGTTSLDCTFSVTYTKQ